MTRVLAINGSYRDDGMTDQIVETMAQSLRDGGNEVDIVRLRDFPIEFCLNCRECTQQPGNAPGTCVQQDGMNELVGKIEAAQAYILASPTNFNSVTAIFKRFMERLIVYAYWPWGTNIPKFRKAGLPKKPAVLVSSSAAPGFIGRWLFGTHQQLKMTAQTIGAKSIGCVFTGFAAAERQQHVPERLQNKARDLATRLISR